MSNWTGYSLVVWTLFSLVCLGYGGYHHALYRVWSVEAIICVIAGGVGLVITAGFILMACRKDVHQQSKRLEALNTLRTVV